MVRHVFTRAAFAVLLSVAALTSAHAQDVWGGGFPDDNVNTATNWISGVVPPGYTAGTDTLEFADNSNSNLNVNVAGISFAGLYLNDSSGNGVSAYIYGPNTISLGSGGLSANTTGDGSESLNIVSQLRLSASQSWSMGLYGSMYVAGPILDPLTGSASLEIDGGSGEYYEFASGSSTFSGGLSVFGNGTTIEVDATGTPFGTGPLLLGDGVSLRPVNPGNITLPNAVTFGDESNGNSVTIGAYPYNGTVTSSVTFNGNATFDTNGVESTDGEIDLQPNTTVTFAGALNGAFPGTNIDLGAVTNSVNSVFIVQGTFGSNLNELILNDNVSVILDGSGVAQFASLGSIVTNSQTYLGLGAGYAGHVAEFLASPQIDPFTFSGTLGFDNTSGGTTTFNEAIDLTNFSTDSLFVGLGSASKAILAGTITPPGGLGLEFGTHYLFGGGGGALQVTSGLVDSSWYDGEVYHNESNDLRLTPGNGPLTLVLSGPLSYSGGTFVDGGALIFDTALPGGTVAAGELLDRPGYIGSTHNSGFLDDDSGSAGTHPQDFISLIETESTGVVGFDDLTGGTRAISGALDMSALPGMFLGTATKAAYSGTIIPYNGSFQFSGVKGGQVTVTTPSITGTDSLVVGLPTPIESFGSVSSVIIPGDNYFSGGTTLNSGYLYVGTYNSLGSGSLTVPESSASFYSPVGLAPMGASVTVPNNISVPSQGLHLNYASSPYTLYLGGAITDSYYNGSLIVDGPVSLSGSNTFDGGVTVNGTTLSVDNDFALNNASFLQATPGSTVNFTTVEPYVDILNLQQATVNFTLDAADPEIDQLSMAMGSHLNFGTNQTPYIYGMNSDDPSSGNVISLGAGTTLTLALGVDPDYHGMIVGPSSSNVTLDTGTLNLIGASTSFSGSVTVDPYALLVASNNAALGTGPVAVASLGGLATNTGVTLTNALTVTDGATLAGFGTFSPGSGITIQNSSLLIPGTANLAYSSGPTSVPVVGRLSFGATTPLTFGGAGSLIIGMTDANGTAGTGYGTVNAAGGLTVSATSLSTFNVVLLSFAPGTNTVNSTQAVNFDFNVPYSWTIVSTPGAIAGFNASAFTIDTSEFLNPTNSGVFSISDSGTDLVLNFTPVPEPSTWALLAAGATLLALAGFRHSRRPCAA